jgi:hypothetical protein
MIQTPVGDEPLDIPRLRELIRKMTGEQLERCGRAAAYMASGCLVWAAHSNVRLAARV